MNLQFLTSSARRKVLTLLVLLISVSWIIWFILTAMRTFDVSDEGVYLLAALDGGNHPGIPSPYGFITGAMYRMSLENIFWFRVCGLVCSVAVHQYLMESIRSAVTPEGSKRISRLGLGVFALVGVTSHYSSYALLTPSYNWLSYHGLILIAGSLLFFVHRDGFRGLAWLHNVIFGFGCAFAFWSKPSSLSFILGAFILLWASSQDRTRLLIKLLALLSTGFLTLLLLSFIQSSPSSELGKIVEAQNSVVLFDPNYGFERAVYLFLSSAIPSAATALLLSATGFALWWLAIRFDSRNNASIFKAPISGLSIVLFTWFAYVSLAPFGRNGVRGLVVPLLMVLIWLVLSFSLQKLDPKPSTNWYFPIFLAGIPLAQAFGSNNGFWQLSVGSGASIAGIILFFILQTGERIDLVADSLVVLFVSTVALQTIVSTSEPYRSPPIWEPRQEIIVGKTKLSLEREFAKNLMNLRGCAESNGWKEGNLLLDFSLFSPGVGYFLGASYPPTLATSVGGYEGSRAFTRHAIRTSVSSLSPDVASIWVLTATEREEYFARSLEHLSDLSDVLGPTRDNFEIVCETSEWALWAISDGVG